MAKGMSKPVFVDTKFNRGVDRLLNAKATAAVKNSRRRPSQVPAEAVRSPHGWPSDSTVALPTRLSGNPARVGLARDGRTKASLDWWLRAPSHQTADRDLIRMVVSPGASMHRATDWTFPTAAQRCGSDAGASAAPSDACSPSRASVGRTPAQTFVCPADGTRRRFPSRCLEGEFPAVSLAAESGEGLAHVTPQLAWYSAASSPSSR